MKKHSYLKFADIIVIGLRKIAKWVVSKRVTIIWDCAFKCNIDFASLEVPNSVSRIENNKDMKIIVLFFVCFTLLACNNNGKPQDNSNDRAQGKKSMVFSAEDIYKQSVDKVAMIISYKNGIPYSQGSGFFIDRNTLVTNFHCVAGADGIEFKVTNNDKVYKEAKVVKASDEYDLAIIKTEHAFPYVKVDSLGNEKIGSKIYAIGNPRGLEGTLSDGILSGKRDNDGIEYLQITAPINPGNSGGPVLNEKGDVIGIATFTFKNSQNLNFAMPIKYLSKCTSLTERTPKVAKKNFGIDKDAVTISNYYCPTIGDENFSLKNNTTDAINNIYGVIVYKTMSGDIFNFRRIYYEKVIPAGLAKIITRENLGGNYVYYKSLEPYEHYSNLTKFQIEFRLISYEIVE